MTCKELVHTSYLLYNDQVVQSNCSHSLSQSIFPSGSQGEEEGNRDRSGVVEEESTDDCDHEGDYQMGKVVFQMAQVWSKIPHGLIDEMASPPIYLVK